MSTQTSTPESHYSSVEHLRWRLGIYYPHELANTTNARRRASLLRQRDADRSALDAAVARRQEA